MAVDTKCAFNHIIYVNTEGFLSCWRGGEASAEQHQKMRDTLQWPRVHFCCAPTTHTGAAVIFFLPPTPRGQPPKRGGEASPAQHQKMRDTVQWPRVHFHCAPTTHMGAAVILPPAPRGRTPEGGGEAPAAQHQETRATLQWPHIHFRCAPTKCACAAVIFSFHPPPWGQPPLRRGRGLWRTTPKDARYLTMASCPFSLRSDNAYWCCSHFLSPSRPPGGQPPKGGGEASPAQHQKMRDTVQWPRVHFRCAPTTHTGAAVIFFLSPPDPPGAAPQRRGRGSCRATPKDAHMCGLTSCQISFGSDNAYVR